jgi:hypothetical protein
VATFCGEFAGYADETVSGFTLYDAHSRALGSFATLGEAQHALAETMAPEQQPARRSRRRRRRPLRGAERAARPRAGDARPRG